MSVSSYICSRLVEDVVYNSLHVSKSDLEVYYTALKKIVAKYEAQHADTLMIKISKLDWHSDMVKAKIQYYKLMYEINRACSGFTFFRMPVYRDKIFYETLFTT